jgi:hypothetical protein
LCSRRGPRLPPHPLARRPPLRPAHRLFSQFKAYVCGCSHTPSRLCKRHTSSGRLLEGANMDEDNDGRFPDDSRVEVRYPRSWQEEAGDRSEWLWLPGSIPGQCGRTCGMCAWRSASWPCWTMVGRRRIGQLTRTCISRAASRTPARCLNTIPVGCSGPERTFCPADASGCHRSSLTYATVASGVYGSGWASGPAR